MQGLSKFPVKLLAKYLVKQVGSVQTFFQISEFHHAKQFSKIDLSQDNTQVHYFSFSELIKRITLAHPTYLLIPSYLKHKHDCLK